MDTAGVLACGACRFSARDAEECRRFPAPVSVVPSSWCGEFQSTQTPTAAHRPSDEQMALGIVKGVANDLTAAADALDEAAYVLKEAGKVLPANKTKQAAGRARKSAQELVG